MEYTTGEKPMGIIDLNGLVGTELLREINHHKEIALKMKDLQDLIKDDPKSFKEAMYLMRDLRHSEMRIKGLSYAQDVVSELVNNFES